MKQFEMDYISKYKDKYNLINQTIGGDYPGFLIHSRESILKKSNTRAVDLYNVLGEFICSYDIMEDIGRTLNLRDKACSHITQCCKGTRQHAYGYIWRYKGDPLGDISNINPKSLYFNKLVQYDSKGNRVAEYDSYLKAAEAIGDRSKGGNIASVISGKQKSCKEYFFLLEPIFVYFNLDLFNRCLKTYKTPDRITYNSKIIQQLDANDNIIHEYNSISEASRAMIGTTGGRPSIKRCCEGVGNLLYKGYKWRYKAS